MRYTVVMSADAKADLHEIYRYIAFSLLVPETALNLISRLEKSILSLCEMPERYRIYDESKWGHLRAMVMENYMIFYTVDRGKQVANIARVLYGRGNFDTVFTDK